MEWLRWSHIAAGFVALFVGPGAMLTIKGGLWHRRWGKIYFWAMAFVAVSAVGLAIVRFDPFMLMIAAFSFYLAASGYEILGRKNPSQVAPERLRLTKILHACGLAAGMGLLGFAFWNLKEGQSGMALVSVVFAVVAARFAIQEIASIRQVSTDRRRWFYQHMGNMLGAYIATVSAFSVVNFKFLPPAVRWLWPSVIGGFGTFFWVRYYRSRETRP